MIDTKALKRATKHPLVDGARLSSLIGNLDIGPERIRVLDLPAVRSDIEQLTRIAAFGPPESQSAAHRLAWETAGSCGVYAASIDAMYRAIGSGNITRKFTVPAVNLRAVAFHSARGVFEAMRTASAGAVIFELSRGEIGFTGQRPHEYATAVLCAAIAERHTGAVFLQGDHFQISASRYLRHLGCHNGHEQYIGVEWLRGHVAHCFCDDLYVDRRLSRDATIGLQRAGVETLCHRRGRVTDVDLANRDVVLPAVERARLG